MEKNRAVGHLGPNAYKSFIKVICGRNMDELIFDKITELATRKGVQIEKELD